MPIEILESRIAPAAITVTNLHPSGTGSLYAAITQANAAGGSNTISFAKNVHGTITEPGGLPNITSDITITGPGASKLAISGGNKHQILYIGYNTTAKTPSNVTISGLTFKAGNSQYGGALEINDKAGTVSISKCTFSGNKAVGPNGYYSNGQGADGGVAQGGAIDMEVGKQLNLTSCTISGNTAQGGSAPGGGPGLNAGNAYGGGLYSKLGAPVAITSSKITGNKAIGGIGLASTTVGTAGANGVPESTSGNNGQQGNQGYAGAPGGSAYGGGICSKGKLAVQSSTISGNAATGGVGGKGSKGGQGGNGGPAYTNNGNPYPAGLAGNGGYGGGGGNGGSAIGGGLWANHNFTITSSKVTGNTVTNGKGGAGGAGGAGGSGVKSYNGYTYGKTGSSGTPGYAGTGTKAYANTYT